MTKQFSIAIPNYDQKTWAVIDIESISVCILINTVLIHIDNIPINTMIYCYYTNTVFIMKENNIWESRIWN